MIQIDALPQPEYQPERVLDALKQAASNELLTCSLYQQVEAQGAGSATLTQWARSACDEDWQHYQALLELIDVLENSGIHALSETAPALSLPQEPESSAHLLNRIEEAEKNTVFCQQLICALTMGYDYKVFDRVYALLNENIQHNLQVHQYRINGERT